MYDGHELYDPWWQLNFAFVVDKWACQKRQKAPVAYWVESKVLDFGCQKKPPGASRLLVTVVIGNYRAVTRRFLWILNPNKFIQNIIKFHSNSDFFCLVRWFLLWYQDLWYPGGNRIFCPVMKSLVERVIMFNILHSGSRETEYPLKGMSSLNPRRKSSKEV